MTLITRKHFFKFSDSLWAQNLNKVSFIQIYFQIKQIIGWRGHPVANSLTIFEISKFLKLAQLLFIQFRDPIESLKLSLLIPSQISNNLLYLLRRDLPSFCLGE